MKKALALLLIMSALAPRLEAQVILQDSFPYPDGILTNVSDNLWTNYSGTIDSAVNNGRLEVFGSRAGDVYRPFTNMPAQVIYASFIVNNTNIASASANYFAHFSANSSTFRARVFGAGNAGGAPNTWRLGITAAGSNPQIYPLDLATNVDYRVVISYDTVNFLGSLWIDPVVETDPNKQTIDTTTAVTLAFFSFRQSNSGGQAGQLQVDDLYVGNSFADVNVGAVKPPTVYYDPLSAVTVFEGGSTNLSCVGGGAGGVTFQWQKDGADLVEDANNVGVTSNVLAIVSAFNGQSGAYRCIVTSTTNGVFAGSVTSAVCQVTVSTAPVPPTITTQPTNQVAYPMQTVTFSVAATGPGTITYQWKSNNVDLAGEVFSTLTIPNVTTASQATYRVGVSNEFGGVLSSNATLTVLIPQAVQISFLRTLVDPTTFLPTNTTTYWTATGVVTSRTNLTGAANASFVIQDSTAGIGVFISGGAPPEAGDNVTVTGPLGNFNGALQFSLAAANPATSIVTNSSGNPLPAPYVLPLTFTNGIGFGGLSNLFQKYVSSLVMFTNVYFPTGGSNFSSANLTVIVTNQAGDQFRLFFNAAVMPNFAGQLIPEFAWSVMGPLSVFLSPTTPDRSSGFELLPTSYSDIVTDTPLATTGAITQPGGQKTITWIAQPYTSYTILSAANVAGPYTPLASGLTFSNTAGQYIDTSAGAATRFFKISSP